MTAIQVADSPSIAASVAAGALPVPFPVLVPETEIYIDFPDFACRIAAPITDLEFERESPRVTVQANVNKDVIITLTLLGTLIHDFRISEVGIDIRTLDERPCAEFTASTLFALCGLSSEVHLRIPAIELDITQGFDLSLKGISQRLHKRQTAYRLMVVESATGLELCLPKNYSGEDVKTIAYLYRAIVHRSFVWPIGPVTVLVPATEERLMGVPESDVPTRQHFGPTRVAKDLFGHTIDLGAEELIIDDAVFDNLAAVRKDLSRNDGHPVEVLIRSLSGIARVVLQNPPNLREPAWDPSIQALINLEPHLDASLANRYNALAASTLADLTEEEKREVTARPELDEAAF